MLRHSLADPAELQAVINKHQPYSFWKRTADHAQAKLKIKLKVKEGNSPWKINNLSLEEPSVHNKIKKRALKLSDQLLMIENQLQNAKLLEGKKDQILL